MRIEIPFPSHPFGVSVKLSTVITRTAPSALIEAFSSPDFVLSAGKVIEAGLGIKGAYGRPGVFCVTLPELAIPAAGNNNLGVQVTLSGVKVTHLTFDELLDVCGVLSKIITEVIIANAPKDSINVVVAFELDREMLSPLGQSVNRIDTTESWIHQGRIHLVTDELSIV